MTDSDSATARNVKSRWIHDCKASTGEKKITYNAIRTRFGYFYVTMATPGKAYAKIMKSNQLNLNNFRVFWLIFDISPLAVFHHLTQLELFDHEISNLAPLQELTNLTYLNLGWNRIEDLTPISTLYQLKHLHLTHNKISNLNPITNLTNLVSLLLPQNQIENLQPIAGLVQLEILHCSWNRIIDVSPLANLVNLTNLSSKWNKIKDLEPIASLVNLTRLVIHHNCICDLSPISNNMKLRYVDLGHNYIQEFRPVDHVSKVYGKGSQIPIPQEVLRQEPMMSSQEAIGLQSGMTDEQKPMPQEMVRQEPRIPSKATIGLQSGTTDKQKSKPQEVACEEPMIPPQLTIGLQSGMQSCATPTNKFVFLSHTGQDQRVLDFVVILKESLRNRYDIATFFDADSIEYACNWMTTIKWNVENCHLFVCNFSTNYPTRYWPMKELDVAFRTGRTILPVFHSRESLDVNSQLKDRMQVTLEKKHYLVEEEGETIEAVLTRWCDNLRQLERIQGVYNTSIDKQDLVHFCDKVAKAVKELYDK